jgi:ABC-2 type transport system ATP-binding protein
MGGTLVEVEGVTRWFGRNRALDGLSFRATEGAVHGLVGANGAGKTTLIRHILGLLEPKEGSVRVFGLDPVRHPVEVLRRIGYLSEERDLPEWMRVDELMAYTRAYHPRWDMAFARELISTFGLDPRKRIKELSKGMRAQVGLVAAVAHRPDLLILDEPSSGLDAVVRRDILDVIVRTVADEGRTVVFSSHLLDEVERMSDHVTMIEGGRVVLDGTLDEVRGAHFRSQIRFADPIDRPPMVEGVVAMEGGGRLWAVLHNGSGAAFTSAVAQQGGEVVATRQASLEEIFVARVGRGSVTRSEAA